MKKLLSLVLVLAMVLSFTVGAWAADSSDNGGSSNDDTSQEQSQDSGDSGDGSGNSSSSSSSSTGISQQDVGNGGNFTIKKDYVVTGTAPDETFTFTAKLSSYEGGNETDAAKPVTLSDISSFTDGTATSTVTLPNYTGVGKYIYEITEKSSSYQGVTTAASPLYLTVWVLNDGNGSYKCVVNLERESAGSGKKVDGFTQNAGEGLYNKYESGSLTVTKTVNADGSMVNLSTQEYTINVSFSAEKDIDAGAIKYTVGTENKTAPATDSKSFSIEIKIKDKGSVTFSNIPAGVTYTVQETSTTGYSVEYKLDNVSQTVQKDDGTTANASSATHIVSNKDSNTVEVVNTPDDPTNTGVSLDTIPYIALMLIATAGLAVVLTRKRHSED